MDIESKNSAAERLVMLGEVWRSLDICLRAAVQCQLAMINS